MLIQKYEKTLLTDLPIKRQHHPYDCAVSCFWSSLHYLESNLTYDTIMALAQTTKEEGTYNVNIIKMLKILKVNFIAENSTIKKIKNYTSLQYPVVVDIQHKKERGKTWKDTWEYGHYVIAVDIDDEKLTYMDPGKGKIRYMPIKEFEERWHDKDGETIYNNYAITCFSKEKERR